MQADQSERESWIESGECRLLRQPLQYLHYLDLSIYSTEIDQFAKEATFPTLSKQMVQEFRFEIILEQRLKLYWKTYWCRQSGALFAGNFTDSSVSLELWRDLTQSGDAFDSVRDIIRLNYPPINYDKVGLLPSSEPSSAPDGDNLTDLTSIGKRKAVDISLESAKKYYCYFKFSNCFVTGYFFSPNFRRKKNSLKLVINSHVNYRAPLSHLLKSVLARYFKVFQ